MNKNHDSSISRRPHLTKEQRLPNCYKEVEKIVKSVKSCQNNFKTVLASSRLRGSQFKKVYKLSLNVLKYYNYIQKIIDKLQLLEKEKFLRKDLAAVLIYELIFGNGSLPGENKAVTTVLAYQNDVMNMHQELQSYNTDFIELNEIYIPRYIRVHTLVTTVAHVIKDLENYGFKQVFYDEDLSEEKFFQLVKSVQKGDFLVDYHFKDILVFAQAENLIELDLYKNGHIFLQDKASYIPVHALNPEPGSTVLDACAAPGMKSIHLASKMKNKGILIASERDESRFETLKETLKYGAVKISKTLCTDFKLIDPNDEAYSAVEYILLDPSCSGSGMVNRMDEVTDTEDSKTKDRLNKLAGFQIILLKHALKFPSVKRVVYSTCSVYEEENEYVVHEALNAFGGTFKLVPVISEGFDRGSENYEYGKMCLRTVPEKHLTNGFFVAMFERIDTQEHRRKNFPLKNAKNETDVRSNDIPHEKVNLSSTKFKSKPALTQDEIKCEKNKIDETTEEYWMGNINRRNELSSSACKKKKYNTNLQQCMSSIENNNFQLSGQYEKFRNSSSLEMPSKTSEITENCDQNFDHMTYRSNTEKSKELQSSDSTKHKKKKKKHKSDIQFKSDEQNQEELVNITSSELIQDCENSEVLKSPKTYYAVDENSNISSAKKKHKLKNHPSPENTSEIFSDMKLKHKKRKRKHSTDHSSFPEVQCDVLEELHQRAGDYQNFNQNVVHNSSADESKELKVPSSFKLAEVVDKKQISLENNPEIIGSSDVSFKFLTTHKERKREHSADENIHTYVQNTETVDKIDSFINKPKKIKKSCEFMLSCSPQSNFLENKSLKGDEDSTETTSPKVKKHKKHKKHSKNSDFTSSPLHNILVNDSSETQNNSEHNPSVKSAENVNNVSQNEKMIKEQNLTNNSSKCKKNKKHKKHASESNVSDETNNYSPDRNLNYSLNVQLNIKKNNTVYFNPDENLANSPNQDICRIKKKREKNKTVETCDSSNFQYCSTNAQYRDVVNEYTKILPRNEVESTVTQVQNDHIKRKKSKKHKKHLADDV